MTRHTLEDDDVSYVHASARRTGDRASGPVLVRGSSISRYVILGQVGSGTGGTVYAAYDPELDRKIALKVLRKRASRSSGSSGVPDRLEREAKAMAKLMHANVVAVHDVGRYEDHLFIAMEFVAGTTLRRWLQGSPRPWREILEVMIPAARGLHAAHRAGLVHRDFKPENVLVTHEGEVRVTDFGLARAPTTQASIGSSDARTSGTMDVRSSDRLEGTPAYMAPEQFRRRPLDARTDQFAFCVVLYEALYAKAPFPGKSAAELAMAVTTGAVPEAPSANVPGWLRRIVLRGLSGEAEDRWPSMDELVAQLEGANRSRRKWGLLGGFAVLTTAMAVAYDAGSAPDVAASPCADASLHLDGAWTDARRGELLVAFEGAREASGLAYAAETAPKVVLELDAWADRWMNVFEAACTGERPLLDDDLARRRSVCLETRRTRLAALVEQLLAVDVDTLPHAVGSVLSLPAPERCQEPTWLAASVPPPDSPHIAEAVASAHGDYAKADARWMTGRFLAALDDARAVVERAREIDYTPLLGEALLLEARIHRSLGDYSDAETVTREAYEVALTAGDDVTAADCAVDLMLIVGYDRGRQPDSQTWAMQARALLTRTEAPPERWARLHNYVGTLAYARGELQEAEAQFLEALGLQESSLGPEHLQTSATLNNLASVRAGLGDLDGARTGLERVLAGRKDTLGPGHPINATTHNNLGNVLRDLGELEGAQQELRRAEAILLAVDPAHTDLVMLRVNLGTIQEKLGQVDEAFEIYVAAREKIRESFGDEHDYMARLLVRLGQVEQTRGHPGEARRHIEQALRIDESAHGADAPQTARTRLALGEVLAEAGDDDAARRELAAALPRLEEELGPDHESVVRARERLRALDSGPDGTGRDDPAPSGQPSARN